MSRIIRQLAVLLLCGPLIAACSFGGATAAPTPSASAGEPQPAAASARPAAVQTSAQVKGRLLFIQNGNLFLYQQQTAQQLTDDGIARDARWSPDGGRIAYVRRAESHSDLYLLDARGGLPTQVTFNGSQAQPRSAAFIHQAVWAAQPSWSPDGAELVFLSQIAPPASDPPFEYPLSIYRYDLQLVGQREPTNNDLLIRSETADLQRPVWSPDGAQLAYVAVPRDSEPKRIMLYDFDSGQAQPFPGIPDNTYDPAWSPDGRWLAFAANVNGSTDVWAIPAPSIGGSPVRLTSAGATRAPAWSPDGSQLALVQVDNKGSNVYLLSLTAEGGALRPGAIEPLTTSGQIDANSGISWIK
jgi:TolB protein